MLSYQEVQPSKLVVKTQLSNHNNFTLSFQRFQDSISWNPRIRNPRSWGLRILDFEDWGSLILRIKDHKILNKYLKLGFQDLGSSILGLSILMVNHVFTEYSSQAHLKSLLMWISFSGRSAFKRRASPKSKPLLQIHFHVLFFIANRFLKLCCLFIRTF